MCAVSPADSQVPSRRTSALQRLYAVAKAELDGKSVPDADATQRVVEALGTHAMHLKPVMFLCLWMEQRKSNAA
jgi:hypothetical protein